MRLVVFGGTSGVGTTTTVAAATAAHAGRSAKVLLVTAAEPVGDLPVLRVDVRAALERRWPGTAGLALPPGADALVTLLEVRDRAVGGDWDAVLVDGPPMDTLLALDGLAGTLEQLWPEHTRIVRRSVFTDAVGSVQAALAAVRELRPSVRLVLDPTLAGVAAARDALTALALHGYAVDGLIADRVLPADPPWAGTVRAAQEAALAGLDVRRAPYLVGDDLAALGREIYGPDDPLAPAPEPPEPVVVPTDAGYELRLVLPFLRRDGLRLARDGDDLLLTVADRLRRLPLPPVLRRCVAVGASAVGGTLAVRFQPDPDLWPAEVAR